MRANYKARIITEDMGLSMRADYKARIITEDRN
jgi:hypothetical protein